MLKSLKLFRLFGVDIKAHWSWLLFFIIIVDFDKSAVNMLAHVGIGLLVFVFVLIHEYGHIFAARKYGVNTPTVVLSLLGGAALIDKGMVDLKPKELMWVIFAGPLTNLVMGLLFLIPLMFMDLNIDMVGGEFTGDYFQIILILGLLVNGMMFLFNLLPIYPMDGGQLLRGALEHFNIKNSLLISIRVTQLFCVGLLVWGISVGSITGTIIAVVFFIFSIFEYRSDKTKGEFVSERNELRSKISVLEDRIKKTIVDLLGNTENDDEKLFILDKLDESFKNNEEVTSESYEIVKKYIDEARGNIK